MEHARLGAGNYLISRVGFGCAPISGYDYGPVDETAWIATVRAALDNGINFFDVADVYGFGRGEELLSSALGEQRHKVALATKFGLVWDSHGAVSRDSSPERIKHALNESLRRLRVDSITLYQLHWPDGVTPLDAVLEVLLRFREEGKIQFIGVSNVSVGQLESVYPAHRIDSVQVPYNLLCRGIENTFITWCDSKATSVLAHSGLARGLLSGKRSQDFHFEGLDTRSRSAYFADSGREEKQQLIEALFEVGKRVGCSPSAVALRWLLDQRAVTSVLVGMKGVAQLEENLRAVGWCLSNDDYQRLSSLSASCPGSLAGSLAQRGSQP